MLEHINYNHVYCLFSKTGSEEQVAAEIEKQQNVRALVAIQEKHKRIGKKYEIDRRVFLPGYLFLYTNEELRFDTIQKISNVYRILGDRNEICELSGYDRSFAEWLYLNDGIVGITRPFISSRNGLPSSMTSIFHPADCLKTLKAQKGLYLLDCIIGDSYKSFTSGYRRGFESNGSREPLLA